MGEIHIQLQMIIKEIRVNIRIFLMNIGLIVALNYNLLIVSIIHKDKDKRDISFIYLLKGLFVSDDRNTQSIPLYQNSELMVRIEVDYFVF